MTSSMMDTMISAAIQASETIMDVYSRPIEAEVKTDGSPVTIADKMAEEIILNFLRPFDLPILAEEKAAVEEIPELGARFFVVDPLDGTKEFINRNGQFTVNIALVEKETPTLGVVLAPALGELFVGGREGAFAYKISGGRETEKTPLRVSNDGKMNVVASRSHGHAALASLCEALDVKDNVSVGSSLKFCLLARGDARIYPRFTPTCEWDTAAGQAVLQAAGGAVYAIDGSPLRYGKKAESFFNPYFAAASDEVLAKKTANKMRQLVGKEGDVICS